MDPDQVLATILRLCATLDLALSAGHPPDDDEVYTLVGLVTELDAWMAQGARPPRRWPVASSEPVVRVVLTPLGASNDVSRSSRPPAEGLPPRKRKALVRRRGSASSAQLCLPFANAGAATNAEG